MNVSVVTYHMPCINNGFQVSLPKYIGIDDVIELPKNTYAIVSKPIGTECFVVIDPPNTFKFYHLTEESLCEHAPFQTIHIPGVILRHSVVLHSTIINNTLCAIHDITYPHSRSPPRNIEITYSTRLADIGKFLSIHPELRNNKHMKFGLPHISSSMDEHLQIASSIPYKIKHLEHILLNIGISNKYPFLVYTTPILPTTRIVSVPVSVPVFVPPSERTTIFKVMADLLPDIYHVFDTSSNESIGMLHIPDIRTSVLMNSIFRTIKENDNLDLLEESDDESDFEDTRIDKYVDLHKVAYLECIHNDRFNRWVPVKLSEKK